MAPIPQFDTEGNLPEGEHQATLDEIRSTFAGTSFRRKELYERLVRVIDVLKERGISDFWVVGSFVTDKRAPRDIDIVYVAPQDVDPFAWKDQFGMNQQKRLKKEQKVHLIGFENAQEAEVAWFLDDDRDDPPTPRGIIKVLLEE